MKSPTQKLCAPVEDLADVLDIAGRTKRSPYGTLAAALGIGYVLGGGLFTPLTGRIVGAGLRVGMRVALLPLLEAELVRMAEGLVGGATDGPQAGSAEVGPSA